MFKKKEQYDARNRTKYISLCALLSIVTLHAEERVVTPKFTIRSQGFNSVRRIPGETGRNIFLYDIDACECGDFYGKISLTPEYTRSFRPHDIARCLFGDALGQDGDGALKIEGSKLLAEILTHYSLIISTYQLILKALSALRHVFKISLLT